MHSVGMSSFIGMDLFILNEGMAKVGYLKSNYISAGVSNDGLSVAGNEGALILPNEIYHQKEKKLVFLMLRGGVYSGKMRKFGDQMVEFVKTHGFSNVVALTASVSPVRRERESNRQIPEVFAYVNNFLHKQQNNKYYENYGIRKFGWWIEADKKKAHQELDELEGAGAAQKLVKTFNRHDIPMTLFVIFCTGGVDFVGGFSYYQFLKHSLFQGSSLGEAGRKLGLLKLQEQVGEEIHTKLFEQLAFKVPPTGRASSPTSEASLSLTKK
eukprot:CAMPEP_0170544446 /NCGR_PEP_ID=MMETSP0211-20121228/3208_1 /TAXON_ID=311385 /ORGANISM="Pseudokeronopsis sp., Strain OXSARD2" /LENGTH=268 /DNA_ID=CAMNT_0010848103 /DNA_START=56 /DNA_END=860 /DNA_ORIENTATION=-